jgi:ribosomal protein L14
MKVIHLYKGFKRSSSETGLYIKASAKKVKPPKIEYKGFKRKYIKKGDLARALIIKAIYKLQFKNTSKVQFLSNSTIVIKKKNVTRSKYFFGLVSKNIKKKKILLLFNKSFKKHSLMVEHLTFNQMVEGSSPSASIVKPHDKKSDYR